MGTPLAIGLAIVVVGAALVGLLLFGHRDTTAPATVRAASPGSPRSDDVSIPLARRLTSGVLLLGLTVGLAGLLAAVVGAVVFLGGLALGS